MPTIDWGPIFQQCLAAARLALDPGDQLLVVFDGQAPAVPDWLREYGAILLETGRRSGPAAARNLAARAAGGDILMFVDADVELHADAADRIATRFCADADLAAVFGSYDDTPAASGLVSCFRNLLHHHVHSRHPGPSTTFWAGCGAVRRDRFLALGGFDANRYSKPSIEDIDFGLRLHSAGGRILLDPTIQGTHHKCWTLALMLRTDILQRAIPWSRLLLERGEFPNSLNLDWPARLSGVLSLVSVAALAIAVMLPSGQRPCVLLMIAIMLLLIGMLNQPMLALLRRRGGVMQLAVGFLLLNLYYFYSSLCLILTSSSQLLCRRRPVLR